MERAATTGHPAAVWVCLHQRYHLKFTHVWSDGLCVCSLVILVVLCVCVCSAF